MTCDLWWLWWLLLWTNHLHYFNYWVSLGRFYLLDIHCDYLFYKPFMWCRWDARLWHCLLFIDFISPLCGVAQTPDCGMFVILLYKPFMWRRSDARLRHALYYYPFKVSLQTPDRCIFNFLLTCIVSFNLGLTKWSWIILVHDYHLLCYTCFHDVCEYIQKYSLACPWLLSWPDFVQGEERCEDSPGTYAMMIAASRR